MSGTALLARRRLAAATPLAIDSGGGIFVGLLHFDLRVSALLRLFSLARAEGVPG